MMLIILFNIKFKMDKIQLISTLLGSLGGISAIGVGIWWMINIRSKKKIERANALRAEAEAEKISDSNEQNNSDWMLRKINELNEYYKLQNTRLDRIQLYNVRLIAALEKSDIFHCEDLSCPHRKPELGKFKTIIKGAEEIQDEGCRIIKRVVKSDRDNDRDNDIVRGSGINLNEWEKK